MRYMWQDYVAIGLYKATSLLGVLGGYDSGLPSWVELAYPDMQKKDNRSPEQIKADLVAFLEKGG